MSTAIISKDKEVDEIDYRISMIKRLDINDTNINDISDIFKNVKQL